MANNSKCLSMFRLLNLKYPIVDCREENENQCVIYKIYFDLFPPAGDLGGGPKFGMSISDVLRKVNEDISSLQNEFITFKEDYNSDKEKIGQIISRIQKNIKDLLIKVEQRKEKSAGASGFTLS